MAVDPSFRDPYFSVGPERNDPNGRSAFQLPLFAGNRILERVRNATFDEYDVPGSFVDMDEHATLPFSAANALQNSCSISEKPSKGITEIYRQPTH